MAKGWFVAVALTGAVLVPSAGSTTSHTFTCGGVAPAQTACSGQITVAGDRVSASMGSNLVFAGAIEVDLTSGNKTAYLGPCFYVTGVLSCDAQRTGAFEPGDVVQVEARLFEYESTPAGLGEWYVSVTG